MMQNVINVEIPSIIRSVSQEAGLRHDPIDMMHSFGGALRPDPVLFLEDGCHPSAQGYELMATEIFQVLSSWASFESSFTSHYSNCAWNYDQLLDHMCPDRNRPQKTCSHRVHDSKAKDTRRTRIAFIGDSITQAHHVRANLSFPHKLQLMLRDRFEVLNLGVSGATMLEEGTAEDGRCPAAFRSTPQWQVALESDADLFFILLGTNDAKAYNWDPDRFHSDYLAMLASLSNRYPSADIILVAPPPLLQDGFGTMNQSVINEELPSIIQSVSLEAKLPFESVDMIPLFGGAESPDQDLLLEDGCHPSEQGYEVMAKKLFQVISTWESRERYTFSDQYTNCAWNYDQLLDHMCPTRNRPQETCSHLTSTVADMGKHKGKRITFIGDSITQAHHVSANESFPHKLQLKLGEEFAVLNLGVSGATMLEDGTAENGQCPAAFRSTPQWQMALESDADIFFILLGTNDAKSYNWDPVRYRSDYLAMVIAIRHKYPHAEIALVIPPPLIQDGFGAMMQNVINVEIPSIIRSVSQEAGLRHDPIDMMHSFGGALRPDPVLFLEDGCHPSAQGYELMATEIFQVLSSWASFESSFTSHYSNCAWNYDQLLDHMCPDRNRPQKTCSHRVHDSKAKDTRRTRIAFIGDSITQAHHVRANLSFPHKLQLMLRDRFEVLNLGVSGATMLEEGTAEDGRCPAAFRSTPQWQVALESDADLFFILLGTNDAKAYNWDSDRYRSDYMAMLKALSSRYPETEIVLIVPPPLLIDGFGAMNQSVIRDDIPRIIQSINDEAQLPFAPLDMINAFGGTNPDPTLYLQDGCHPSEQGYDKMARALSDFILTAISTNGLTEPPVFSELYAHCAWTYFQLADHMCPGRSSPSPTCLHRATKSTAEQVRIAFIGDSITQGDQIRADESFPHLLQLKLGESFTVMNLGVSGSTMSALGSIEEGTCPASFRSTPQWQMALESDADIFFICLGAYDAKSYNWDPARYRSDYTAMVHTLQRRHPRSTVVLVIPPPLVQDGAYSMSKFVINYELPSIIRSISRNAELPYEPIDMIDLFGGATLPDQSLILGDGFHPSEQGHERVAAKLTKFILESRLDSSTESFKLASQYTHCAWNYATFTGHTCSDGKHKFSACSHRGSKASGSGITRVAFIGDSLTQGGEVNAYESFPHSLQLKLGKQFVLSNYGVAGSTVITQGVIEGGKCASSFRRTPQWQMALEDEADIFFLVLGMNDALPGSWDPVRFRADCTSILTSIYSRHPHSKVILVIPPAFIDGVAHSRQKVILSQEIPPIVRSISAAADLILEPIDLSRLRDDAKGPSKRGHQSIATEIFHIMRSWASGAVSFAQQYTHCALSYNELLESMCPDRSQSQTGCMHRASNAEVSKLTRVAFIGDSITQGDQVSAQNSFPHQLQLKLGDNFAIYNFGVSGATMLAQGTTEEGKCPASFRSTPQWHMVLESEADVFFICLGTNDAKSYNWDAARYRSDYMDMIKQLKLYNPRSKIILMIPPPVLRDGAYSIQQAVIRSKIPDIIRSINREAKLPHDPVDLIEVFGGAVDLDPRLFLKDGCHPSERGYKRISAGLVDLVMSSRVIPPAFVSYYSHCAWDYPEVVDYMCSDRHKPPALCSHRSKKITTQSATRITFIGDSITQGDQVSADDSFPHKLQVKLGNSVTITNLGVSGSTMLTSGRIEEGKCPASFRRTPQWQSALDSEADIYFICLGTNDAKSYNWDPIRYRLEYLQMIGLLALRHPYSTIILIIPPPLLQDGAYGIQQSVLNQEIPSIVRSISMEARLPHEAVDLVQLFGGATNPDRSLILEDGCHPNELGYERIATNLFEVLSANESSLGSLLADRHSDDGFWVDAADRICSSALLVLSLAFVANL
eukprot:TRINITY_DN17324_c0_g1_i1.p1 TRINITY_DN17324_c0_g1~~TRINITY_DN17324_c0_g1_i1.p1  ORF type:complete len:1947 (-),score=220.81 TRINITY_DN17324_c0_g1_i1:189-5807(-)